MYEFIYESYRRRKKRREEYEKNKILYALIIGCILLILLIFIYLHITEVIALLVVAFPFLMAVILVLCFLNKIR